MTKKEIIIGVGFLFMMAMLAVTHYEIRNVDYGISLQVENGMVMTMEATGYAIGPPYNSITRNENPVINKGFLRIGDVDIFTIASDPKVLKMGSVVYIERLGIGLVHDTGTKIKGMKIDICFTTMDEAMKFGKQDVRIHLLRNGSVEEEVEK